MNILKGSEITGKVFGMFTTYFLVQKIKRWVWIFLVIGSMVLYLPVNRLISGGRAFEIETDKIIPLISIFVVPYLFGIIFWVSTIIYINLKRADLAKQFNIVIITASILSVLIYVFYPTFVNRPEITGTDTFSNILSWIYANDRVYNAAPSGHTFYTLLCLSTLWKALPRQRIFWAIISTLIVASTVFTKQHNLIDVFAGVAFAVLIEFLIVKLVFRK